MSRCLVCEEELEVLNDESGQAWGSTVFTSRGGFGSTVFDPMVADGGDRYLRVNVCDNCLIAKARSGIVWHVKVTPVEPEIDIRAWRPTK